MLMSFALLPCRLTVMKTKMRLAFTYWCGESWMLFKLAGVTSSGRIKRKKTTWFHPVTKKGALCHSSKLSHGSAFHIVTSADFRGKVVFTASFTQDLESQFTKGSRLMPVHHHDEVFITLLKEMCWHRWKHILLFPSVQLSVLHPSWHRVNKH